MALKMEETLDLEVVDMVRRMAYIAEYRKPSILSHLERVRCYSFLLARGSGLSERESNILALACQLHDVGEVMIPSDIYARNGQLTPFEWEMVKRHPVIGADLLKDSPSPVLQMGMVVALTHHERWDGSGYPRGLKGEDIPLIGRICALADVFDALTTKRPYKAEVAPEAALSLLTESTEQYFDPALIKIFGERFSEVVNIRKLNI